MSIGERLRGGMDLNGSLYPDLSTSTVQAHAPSLSQTLQWGERHPPTGPSFGGRQILLTTSALLLMVGASAFSTASASSVIVGFIASFLAGIPALLISLIRVTSSPPITGQACLEPPPCSPGGLETASLRGLRTLF